MSTLAQHCLTWHLSTPDPLCLQHGGDAVDVTAGKGPSDEDVLMGNSACSSEASQTAIPSSSPVPSFAEEFDFDNIGGPSFALPDWGNVPAAATGQALPDLMDSFTLADFVEPTPMSVGRAVSPVQQASMQVTDLTVQPDLVKVAEAASTQPRQTLQWKVLRQTLQ